MRAPELENLTLAAIDRAQAGTQYEDSRIEFKTTWPPSPKEAARRIAGHLNAARNDWGVWIIGVKPDGTVVGAEHKELANWWPQVEKHFDQVPPTLSLDLAVPRGDLTVVALLFDATRVPFVIKAGERLETPWREGTRVRSARREDLLRVLVPEGRKPIVEVLSAFAEGSGFLCMLSIVPRSPEPVAFVQHRTRVEYDSAPAFSAPIEFRLNATRPDRIEPWIHMVTTGVVMDRGGVLIVKTQWVATPLEEQGVTIHLARPDPAESPVVVRVMLIHRGDRWVVKE
jgi:hypothetical protein